MTKTITFATTEGGVGKTTLTQLCAKPRASSSNNNIVEHPVNDLIYFRLLTGFLFGSIKIVSDQGVDVMSKISEFITESKFTPEVISASVLLGLFIVGFGFGVWVGLPN